MHLECHLFWKSLLEATQGLLENLIECGKRRLTKELIRFWQDWAWLRAKSVHETSEVWNPTGVLRQIRPFWSQHLVVVWVVFAGQEKNKTNAIQMSQLNIHHIIGLINSDLDPNPRCHLWFCSWNIGEETLVQKKLRIKHSSFLHSQIQHIQFLMLICTRVNDSLKDCWLYRTKSITNNGRKWLYSAWMYVYFSFSPVCPLWNRNGSVYNLKCVTV